MFLSVNRYYSRDFRHDLMSDKFIFFQPALFFPVARADAFQKRVELWRVVQVLQMTQFVKHHIVLKVLRDPHQIQIKVYVSL